MGHRSPWIPQALWDFSLAPACLSGALSSQRLGPVTLSGEQYQYPAAIGSRGPQLSLIPGGDLVPGGVTGTRLGGWLCLEGAVHLLESCLSPRPWQGDGSRSAVLSRAELEGSWCQFPGSHKPQGAPKLMSSVQSRVCRPHHPFDLQPLLLFNLPPPGAMQVPRAAAMVETGHLKQGSGKSSYRGRVLPAEAQGLESDRPQSPNCLTSASNPRRARRRAHLTSLPILPGDRAFAKMRPWEAFTCHWHK